LDTVKDHIKSKRHILRNRKQKEGASFSKQTTSICVKSKDLREEFVLDYLKRCTVADIPLEKN